jgi:serine/threonine protein kinase
MNRSVKNNPSFELTPRYELIRELGRGLMGVVFEVLDRETGQPVAAKLLAHVHLQDTARFRRVVEALGRLDHPHLARYVEYLEQDSQSYLIEQYVDGIDLLDYLRQPASAEELEALRGRDGDIEEGLSDSDEIPPSGPIEVDPDFELDTGETPTADNESDGEQVSSDEGTQAPEGSSTPAESDVVVPADVEQRTATQTVELVDLVEERPEDLGQESAAEIVEELAAESSTTRDRSLDLVFLRLERILPQLVDALEHLHRFRKHHGNLKPCNILVDRNGRCLLTDYGLLHEMTVLQPETEQEQEQDQKQDQEQDQEKEQKQEQADGTAVALPEENSLATLASGTFDSCAPPDVAMRRTYAYRAPETLGLDESSPQADLYALGCVLFEAVSGERAFDGTADEIRDQQLNAEPRSLSEIEPHCPASWADVIHGLLDKNPARRPSLSEVGELVEYSESYAIGIPPSAVPEQEFFFGRSELVDDILSETKRCYQRKRLGVSVLRGPAGVGKTAISQAVSYLASRRGWLVLSGKCYNRESLIYQGWDEIAAQIADIFRELPQELRDKADACRRQAAALFPVLKFDSDPPTRDLDRLDAIDSFRNLLRRLSSQRPLLLLMDDLHWASRDTSSLLLDLIGEPHGLRCMVLGTWLEDQHEGSHPLLDWLDTAPAPVHWLDVRGFSKDEAREYVISAGSHLSLQDQRRVLKRGEFNPLLLEELIHETREADKEDVDATVESDNPTLGEGASSPVTEKLTDVLQNRIEALSKRERFVLQVLSVASIPLPGTMISTIVDEEFRSGHSVENTARDTINRLLEARFIEAVESHHWKVAYTVSHNAHRQLILDQLREQHYAHLCKRIADGVRRCWPAAEELRFEYLLRAGQDREAADAAIRAASSAEKRFAYNRAAKLWRWLTEHAGHTSLSADINPQVEHGRLEFLAHRFEDAAALYHEAARDTDPGLKRVRLLREEFEASVHGALHDQSREALDKAFGTFGESYFQRGFFSRLGEVKNRAIAATNRWTDNLSKAEVDAADEQQRLRAELYKLALDVTDLLDPAMAEPVRTRLSVLAEQTNDAWVMGVDRLYLARQASTLGGARRNRRICRWIKDAVTLFEQASDWKMCGLAEIFLADQMRLTGRFKDAEERLAMAAKYFRSNGKCEFRQRYLLKLSYAQLLLARGKLDDAESVARQILHMWRGDRYVTFRTYQVLIPCYMITGRTALVEHLLDRCHKLLDKTPTNLAQVWVERMSAQLNIALGRPEVGIGQLDVLAERMHANGLSKEETAGVMLKLSLGQALAALAERELALMRNRAGEALERLKDTVRYLERRIDDVPLATRAEIGRLLVRYELLRGRPKKALRVLDRTLEKLVDYENPLEFAKCLEARGVVYRALEMSSAPNHIDQAQSVYSHYGAHLPLFIEGWPVPSKFSRLSKDED